MTLKFIDLFCGLGAFHLGLQKAGIDAECVFASDINEQVREIYAENFGLVPKGDITKIKEDEIPEFDLLCAGSPCQSHSIAGKKTGLEDKERGQLIYHVFRIARHHKPKYIMIENVKNLLSVSGGSAFKTIYDELSGMGYNVHYDVLNAARYGAQQARERLYVVCVRNDLDEDFAFPAPGNDMCRVADVIDREYEANDAYLRENYDIQELETEQYRRFKPKVVAHLVNRKSGKSGRQGERVYALDHPGATICASSGGPGAKTGLYNVNGVLRTLNVKECLRMFGFPEDYKYTVCSDKQMIGFLGNSIVVPVLAALYKELFT